MIDFERPGEQTGAFAPASPHQLIVDGMNIDEDFTDSACWVETLSVEGRQTNEYDIQTASPAGRDGEMYLNKSMNAKTITVTVEFDADDADIIKDKMRRLNGLLRATNYIQFSDEEEYYYYVKFEGASVDEEGARQEVTLNFFWYDPVKYTSEQTFEYTDTEPIEIESMEPVRPYIEIKFNTGIKQWSLRNTTTDKNINYEHEIVSSVYRLYLDADEQIITKNVDETDAMDGVNIESDVEGFTINTDDQLVLTPTPSTDVTWTMTVKYRGVSL